MFEEIFQSLFSWFSSYGLKVLLIILGAIILQKILKKFTRKVIRLILENADVAVGGDSNIDENRVKTISHILNSTFFVLIISVAIIMILGEFGFDITPIIAGAGIIGLAVGFGSQNLVKDLVSGFFILLENQYNIGDKVNFGSKNGVVILGVVKSINLRRTVIVGDQGDVYIIPNGSISLVVKISD